MNPSMPRAHAWRVCAVLIAAACVCAMIGCEQRRYNTSTRTTPGDPTGSGDQDASSDTSADASVDVVPTDDASPDVAPPDDVGPDTRPPEPGGRACELQITAVDADTDGLNEPYACTIPLRSMDGCDALARCVCALALETLPREPEFTVESCARWGTTPRGMITLADFCGPSGQGWGTPSSIGALVREAQLTQADPFATLGVRVEVEASPECDAVAAFSLHGRTKALEVAPTFDGEQLPDGVWTPDEDALFETPLWTLEDIAWMEAETSTFGLTDVGAARFEETLSAIEAQRDVPMSWAGWAYVMHDTESVFDEGVMVSETMSSQLNTPVIVVEDAERSAFTRVSIRNGWPSDGPGAMYGAVAAVAADRKLVDAMCISTCGCPEGYVCDRVQSRCTRGSDAVTCVSDDECCYGQCVDGECAPR